MIIFDKPLSECPKCSSFAWRELDTIFENNDVMIQIVQCCDCKLTWEERWIYASTVIEELEENED